MKRILFILFVVLMPSIMLAAETNGLAGATKGLAAFLVTIKGLLKSVYGIIMFGIIIAFA